MASPWSYFGKLPPRRHAEVKNKEKTSEGGSVFFLTSAKIVPWVELSYVTAPWAPLFFSV